MAEVTSNYELMAVFSLKDGEEAAAANVEKFKNLIEGSATLTNVDDWGKKKTAYPLNDETEADYVVYEFTAKTDFPKELSRVLNITDGVLRSLITVKED